MHFENSTPVLIADFLTVDSTVENTEDEMATLSIYKLQMCF